MRADSGENIDEIDGLPADHDERMERARRSLDGLSIGDAYGCAFEIASFSRIEQARWSYTDDTVMAMAIVRILRRRGRIDQDELAAEFAADFEAEPRRGYGGGAQALLRAIAKGKPWRAESQGAFGGTGSMGNGAAMRVAPLGAYFAGEPHRAAAEASASAEVTHAHLEAKAGAIAVSVAAASAVSAPGRSGLFEPALDYTPASLTRDKIEQARILPPNEPVARAAKLLGAGESILAQDTVPFGLWMASRHAFDFRDAIESTASAGGDIDTNCAIVGGIVALSAGRDAIPVAWLRAREFLKG